MTRDSSKGIAPVGELAKISKQVDSLEFTPVWEYFVAAAILLMLLDWSAAALIAHRKSTTNIDHI